MAKDRRIIVSSACGNGTGIIALATFIVSLVPLAPVYAQVSVASARIADTSKSTRRCDAHTNCSSLSIETRALFTDNPDADTADSDVTSKKYVAVNISRVSQRDLIALPRKGPEVLAPFGLTDASFKFGNLTVNMDSDNAFPEHNPMASADLVLSVHRKF